MDKEMSRKILFDKKGTGGLAKEGHKKAKKVDAEMPQTVPQKQISLLEWLEAHDLIKIRTLCLKGGVDPGSFHRWMNVTKEIPAQAIDKLTPILKDYGFDPSV